ncbi:GlcNAc transferase [Haemophilus sputorum]|uniref:GlcNAc transferase n=1 Tax=Haemophilus sputorum TaxID=1078480 RepID=A0A369YDZ3_9PAST|nr:LysM-like peptidoglycan-binding domain-containing protein [Haemophilus sputorum]RDE70841.1 GlcNAc transferase [Haemophilus sputorum]
MSQNNFRKEPTFGEPSNNTQTPNVSAEAENVKPIAPSLRTNTSPGHTFVPPLKRPENNKEVPKAEEVKKAETAKPTGFTFEPVAEKAEKTAGAAAQAVKNAEESAKSAVQEVAKAATERVIPNVNAGQSVQKPAATPSKGRRLGLVALLAAILGAVFFWLKPSTPETVEELQQQQGGNLPIEFRPVDEAEAQRAEAQAKAEREAAEKVQQQAQQSAQQPAQSDVTTATQPTEQVQTQATPPATIGQTPAVETPIQPTTPNATNTPTEPTQTAANTGLPTPPVKVETQKPKTQGSVIHQSEHKTAQKQPPVKAMTADEFNAKKAKNAQMDQLVKNVESGKPVPKTATAPATQKHAEKAATTAAAAPATSTNNAAVSSKTMTVPKSTSLMQVFRDNKLNISDVNAMSKANGIVSKLKENEKVTVRLDKNNRVVEMSIGSGGKFTRQADGSYTFK